MLKCVSRHSSWRRPYVFLSFVSVRVLFLPSFLLIRLLLFWVDQTTRINLLKGASLLWFGMVDPGIWMEGLMTTPHAVRD